MLDAKPCTILHKDKIGNALLYHLDHKCDKEASKVDTISHMAKNHISYSIQLDGGSDKCPNQADFNHDIECTGKAKSDQYAEKANRVIQINAAKKKEGKYECMLARIQRLLDLPIISLALEQKVITLS